MKRQLSFWPPSEKDSSGQRLQEALKESKINQEITMRINADIGLNLSPLWKQNNLRMIAADFALTLSDHDENDIPVVQAFAAAGLDPANPLHWRQLISILCNVHFGPQRRGRKKEREGYLLLYQRAIEIEKESGGKRNDSQTARLLKQKFRNDYRDKKIDALRKLLPKARAFVTDVIGGKYFGHPLLNLHEKERAKQGKTVSSIEIRILSLLESLLPQYDIDKE